MESNVASVLGMKGVFKVRKPCVSFQCMNCGKIRGPSLMKGTSIHFWAIFSERLVRLVWTP